MEKFEEIQIDQLLPGMIVNKLDTAGINFRYYGVPIPNSTVITELKVAGIKTVFIIATTTLQVTPHEIIEEEHLAESPDIEDLDDLDLILASLRNDVDEKEQINLADISKVEDMHMRATNEMKDILNNLKFGKALDVSSIRGIITEFVLFADKNPQALANSIRLKNSDDYLCNHSVNVCLLSISLSSKMKLSLRDMNTIGLAALLHDIGMTKVPEYILEKPNKLTEHEFDKIKRHPLNAYDMISRWDRTVSKTILQGILQHHERIDGSGYPSGLSGNQISLVAQILCAADMYDALTTGKRYRKANPHTEVIKTLYNMAGKSLNSKIVKTLVSLVGVYPVSTILRLDTGEMAVVFDGNPDHIDKPKIIIFTNVKGEKVPPSMFNLAKSNAKKIDRSIPPSECDITPGNIITGFIATRI